MKINSNEGTLGGSVIQINDNGNGQSILWVQHTPIAEGQYQPKPVLLRLIINTPLVQDLAIVNGTAIIAKVEINSFQAKGNNASKLTITEYVVIDVLSVSNGGESIANEFLLGGTVGKVEKNPNNAWMTVSLALQKSKNDPTVWVRISVHEKFATKAFKYGINKGDNLLIKAKVQTHSYEDRNQNRVVSNDFKIDRVLMLECRNRNQQANPTNTPAPSQSQYGYDMPTDQGMPAPGDYSVAPTDMYHELPSN
ncbi:single-stranded DNA-binding protein [Photobacterium aquimaris]|uniref:Single-stranded DNA-binding protein n=1 Tax=Photobacterium aquimaris TaxID=512643 RepID=A0A2T3I0M9_9GAMM|nr:single-stranded DNA-binding protein [Photobacterium aquimaris]OBU25616.1 hypothetical protein AYY21_08525 [Photobacterium aquimaris]PQJ37085.1 hypothetical protein BTN98_18260 [Photobacterium aquimaris]PSU10060.1 hypothetical protein C0W81_04875 [Photobacterium aquimaris]